jgi:hypothetical protein
MAFTEVLFKVGNGTKATDGMPIAILGSGMLITKDMLLDYIQNNTTPPGFSELQDNEKDAHWRRLGQIKYLTNAGRTAQEVALQRYGLKYSSATVQQRAEMDVIGQKYIDQAVIDRARIVASGYDTNWGFGDLTVFGVICVDLSAAIVEDLVKRHMDEAAHPYADPVYLRFRRWRIPYENLLSAGVVAQLQDPNQLVPVDRTTVFTPAQIKQAL